LTKNAVNSSLGDPLTYALNSDSLGIRGVSELRHVNFERKFFKVIPSLDDTPTAVMQVAAMLFLKMGPTTMPAAMINRAKAFKMVRQRL